MSRRERSAQMSTKRTDVLRGSRNRRGGESDDRADPTPRHRGGPVVFDDGRTFGASLFTPAGTGRRHRRHHAREARGIEVAQRKAWMERRQAEIEAVRAEQRSAGYLPKGGEKGPRRAPLVPQAEGAAASGHL